jgi:hypothetical protein
MSAEVRTIRCYPAIRKIVISTRVVTTLTGSAGSAGSVDEPDLLHASTIQSE